MSDPGDKFNQPRPQASGSNPYSSASEAILKALRPRRGQETGKWLAALGQDAVQLPSGPASGALLGAGERKALMKSWIDKMFDDFERYSYEFNQTASGSDLLVQCQRPSFVADSIQSGSQGIQALTFEGHLATRFWTLLLRGDEDRMEIFVIPSEMLLGFSMNPAVRQEYPPFMEILACWEGSELKWKVAGETISSEKLSPLARELFGDLVRIASGTMSESELFSAHTPVSRASDRSACGHEPASSSRLGANVLSSLSLFSASQNLHQAVQSDIDSLSAAASRAFQADDMSGAEANNVLIKRLKDFQEKLSRLLDDLSCGR